MHRGRIYPDAQGDEVRREVGGWVHGILGWPIYCFWSAILGSAILLCAATGDPDRRRAIGALHVLWGRALWATMPMWRRELHGLENIGLGPYIIVSNHRSVIDIPALYGLPLPVAVVARSGIFRVPVIGPFVRLSGQIETARFAEDARAALAAGVSVLVFAEGTRSPDAAVHRFHGGAFRLAVETGRPILPVAIDGSQVILPKRGWFPTALTARVRIRVLPPVTATPNEAPRALCGRVHALVARQVGELVA